MENLEELKEERSKLEERIKRLERDLKTPLSRDKDDDATDLKDREVLYGLYQVEKKNLQRIVDRIARISSH